jgi:hypothetical protein
LHTYIWQPLTASTCRSNMIVDERRLERQK